MFNEVYKGKSVLVTGHTGFKGSWLTAWLLKLGAKVIGVSKDIPTNPSMFKDLDIENYTENLWIDVRDLESIRNIIFNEKPDFIFHLAAQAIVSHSYDDPVETMTTNIVGTMNILESLRGYKKSCSVILITSDKCYDNVEWSWGYRESDALGGKDIYSGSKGAAELVIKSYFHSFFKRDSFVRISVGRAGNVIGGGDWAKDRIIPDCIRAWTNGDSVEIRSPNATRPWQHVLEPLSGYLRLGQLLSESAAIHGEAFNFGPCSEQNRTVLEIIEDLGSFWEFKKEQKIRRVIDDLPFHEASLLKLNCDKALLYLKWQPTLCYSEIIELIGDWYTHFYKKDLDMYQFTMNQILFYERMGMERNRIWAR